MRLFSMPDFLSGAARALDIGSTFDGYNESENGDEADRKAILTDWQQVGIELISAMEKYDHVEEPEK